MEIYDHADNVEIVRSFNPKLIMLIVPSRNISALRPFQRILPGRQTAELKFAVVGCHHGLKFLLISRLPYKNARAGQRMPVHLAHHCPSDLVAARIR